MPSPFVTWVEPADLGFNSAHFITYGNVCENLHGHNFHTRVTAHGEDTGEGYVLDFVALTRLAREICQELSDRVILPAIRTGCAADCHREPACRRRKGHTPK